MSRFAAILLLNCSLAVLFTGCAKPNPVTIQLRKENQQLNARIDSLRQQNNARLARIATLEQQTGPSVPTLAQSRLDAMFTVHSIELGRQTGGYNPNPDKPGDQGLRIYLTPLDENGDPLKATGQVTVEAYDLAMPLDNRIGRWVFEPAALKGAWRSLGPLHAFVLTPSWQSIPRHSETTVKVGFRDELTGRTFSAIKDIRVTLPPGTTQPTAKP